MMNGTVASFFFSFLFSFEGLVGILKACLRPASSPRPRRRNTISVAADASKSGAAPRSLPLRLSLLSSQEEMLQLEMFVFLCVCGLNCTFASTSDPHLALLSLPQEFPHGEPKEGPFADQHCPLEGEWRTAPGLCALMLRADR